MPIGTFGVELLSKFCHASKSMATFVIPMQWLCSLAVPTLTFLFKIIGRAMRASLYFGEIRGQAFFAGLKNNRL